MAVSVIDPTKPVDQLPAVKADLRSNLLAAKTRLETLERGAVNIMDFGAIEGSTTTASQTANSNAFDAAVAYCKINDVKTVLVPPGQFSYNRTIWISGDDIRIVGAGMRATTLQPTTPFTGLDPAAFPRFGTSLAPAIYIGGPRPEERTNYNGVIGIQLACAGLTAPHHDGICLSHATAQITLEDILIRFCPRWSIIVDGDVFFLRANNIALSTSGHRGDAGNGGYILIKGSYEYPGTFPLSNGNTFSNFTVTMDTTKFGKRLIEINNGCTHNIFDTFDVQSITLRRGDAMIYVGATWNEFRGIKNFDGDTSNNVIITATSAGTSNRIRCTSTGHGLKGDGLTVKVSGITGANGHFAADWISNSQFDLIGTTFSGLSEAGTYALGGLITETAAGHFNNEDDITYIRCTSVAHALCHGQRVTITGLADAPDGMYEIDLVDSDHFDLFGTDYVGPSDTGSYTWTDDGLISATMWFSGPEAAGNIVSRLFGLIDGNDTCLVKFTGGASQNLVMGVDRAGGGVKAYYADAVSTNNTIEMVRAAAGSGINDLYTMVDGSSRLLNLIQYGNALQNHFPIFTTLYGGQTGGGMGEDDRFTGAYLNVHNNTGSTPRSTGWPGALSAQDGYDTRLWMQQLTATYSTSMTNSKLFGGTIHTANNTTAPVGGTIYCQIEGKTKVVGLDATGIAIGSPVYISAAGGYTFTPPTTGYCIMAGWLVKAANPAHVMILRNPLSEYARRSRLGMQRFTAAPTTTTMDDEEISVGVVGGVGRMFYKTGGTIYEWPSNLVEPIDMTTSRNAATTDAGTNRLVRSNNLIGTLAVLTYTIQANVIPVRSVINLLRWNTGGLTVAPGAGVILNHESGYTPALVARYVGAQLIHDPLNTWTLVGKLTPIP